MEESTFTWFPKLSKELQLEIFKEAAVLEPRTISVTLTRKSSEPESVIKFKLLTPTPAILHACHNARTEALKTYRTHAFTRTREDGTESKEIYYNPKIDTLVFQAPKWATELGESACHGPFDWIHYDWRFLQSMARLKNDIDPTSTDWFKHAHTMVEIGLEKEAEDEFIYLYVMQPYRWEAKGKKSEDGGDMMWNERGWNEKRQERATKSALRATRRAFPSILEDKDVSVGDELFFDVLWKPFWGEMMEYLDRESKEGRIGIDED